MHWNGLKDWVISTTREKDYWNNPASWHSPGWSYNLYKHKTTDGALHVGSLGPEELAAIWLLYPPGLAEANFIQSVRWQKRASLTQISLSPLSRKSEPFYGNGYKWRLRAKPLAEDAGTQDTAKPLTKDTGTPGTTSLQVAWGLISSSSHDPLSAQPRVLPSLGAPSNFEIRWLLGSRNHRGFGDEPTSGIGRDPAAR